MRGAGEALGEGLQLGVLLGRAIGLVVERFEALESTRRRQVDVGRDAEVGAHQLTVGRALQLAAGHDPTAAEVDDHRVGHAADDRRGVGSDDELQAGEGPGQEREDLLLQAGVQVQGELVDDDDPREPWIGPGEPELGGVDAEDQLGHDGQRRGVAGGELVETDRGHAGGLDQDVVVLALEDQAQPGALEEFSINRLIAFRR